MMTLAPSIFELRRDESFTIRIDCEGGAYLAFGEVNAFPLRFNDQAPQAQITPAILAGPQSVNRIHLHLAYSVDAPPQRYRVTILDENSTTVDTINSTFNPNRPLPYRVDVDLRVEVE